MARTRYDGKGGAPRRPGDSLGTRPRRVTFWSPARGFRSALRQRHVRATDGTEPPRGRAGRRGRRPRLRPIGCFESASSLPRPRAFVRRVSGVRATALRRLTRQPEDGERLVGTLHRDDVTDGRFVDDVVPVEKDPGVAHLVQEDERSGLAHRAARQREPRPEGRIGFADDVLNLTRRQREDTPSSAPLRGRRAGGGTHPDATRPLLLFLEGVVAPRLARRG